MVRCAAKKRAAWAVEGFQVEAVSLACFTTTTSRAMGEALDWDVIVEQTRSRAYFFAILTQVRYPR